ncbi:MarR family winged helix-turn-helix transcriptional regulator [Streptomyces sp. NPDC087263]|uniref:MarR family winged helix-turn-helix transcriptional regulator n=1 Tax=Streptomyces sp. NPDC087263 TaxID=3365773 RepID=UPI00380D0891
MASVASPLQPELPPSDPGESPSSEELVEAWTTIVLTYNRVSRDLIAKVEAVTGVPGRSFDVLVRLLRAGDQPVSLTRLSRTISLSSGGFTKLADRLEQAGLIERQPSTSDRRVINAVLTPTGRAQAEQGLAVFVAEFDALVARRLGADGLRALAGYMRELGADYAYEG